VEPPGTIHRIFQIFQSRDLVIKNDEGRYTPGLAVSVAADVSADLRDSGFIRDA
jgi:DNA-binding IclR family transcriptional regulator